MKASLPYKYIISVKNGKHYVVFDFKDKAGKRKRKWASTGLPEKCTKKALNGMTSGQTIRVLTTEPGSVRDFRAFCRQSGNVLVGAGTGTAQNVPVYGRVPTGSTNVPAGIYVDVVQATLTF